MTGPAFGPGQVVLYEYLWAREAKSGQLHGRKERPCAVVISTTDLGGQLRVFLAPVTHSPPTRPEDGLEIPADVKRRLGLDDAASWLVVTELNTTLIPAPEFRMTPDRRWAYGYLPQGLLARGQGRPGERRREQARHYRPRRLNPARRPRRPSSSALRALNNRTVPFRCRESPKARVRLLAGA